MKKYSLYLFPSSSALFNLRTREKKKKKHGCKTVVRWPCKVRTLGSLRRHFQLFKFLKLTLGHIGCVCRGGVIMLLEGASSIDSMTAMETFKASCGCGRQSGTCWKCNTTSKFRQTNTITLYSKTPFFNNRFWSTVGTDLLMYLRLRKFIYFSSPVTIRR